MLRMYWVRHGETSCNVANVLCGRCDTSLTENGRQTAQNLATAFAQQRWDALYSSPLRRALQTIAPLARAAGLGVTPLPEMTEIDFGAWDGCVGASLLQTDEAYRAWVEHPARKRAPGGESGDMVLARALRGIAHIRARVKSGNVMVMTHKTTLRLLLCHFSHTPTQHYRQRFDQPGGAVNIVDFFPGEIHLRSLGDISYQRGSCNPSLAGGAK